MIAYLYMDGGKEPRDWEEKTQPIFSGKFGEPTRSISQEQFPFAGLSNFSFLLLR